MDLAVALSQLSDGIRASRDLLSEAEAALCPLLMRGGAPAPTRTDAGLQLIDRLGQRLEDLARLAANLAKGAGSRNPAGVPVAELTAGLRLAEIRALLLPQENQLHDEDPLF